MSKHFRKGAKQYWSVNEIKYVLSFIFFSNEELRIGGLFTTHVKQVFVSRYITQVISTKYFMIV